MHGFVVAAGSLCPSTGIGLTKSCSVDTPLNIKMEEALFRVVVHPSRALRPGQLAEKPVSRAAEHGLYG